MRRRQSARIEVLQQALRPVGGRHLGGLQRRGEARPGNIAGKSGGFHVIDDRWAGGPSGTQATQNDESGGAIQEIAFESAPDLAASVEQLEIP